MTTENMKSGQSAPDHPGILRDLQLYCTSNGPNSGYTTHIFTYRVEDVNGVLVYTNAEELPVEHSGTTDLGSHACLLDWLPRWRPQILDRLPEWKSRTAAGGCDITDELYATRTLTIVDNGTNGVFKAYTVPAEQLAAKGFKKPSGELMGNAAWIAEVLAEAEELGVKVTCNKPASVHEVVTLGLVRNQGKRRWAQVVKERTTKFVR